ncbi:hypothetical protein AAG570_010986 [Ranatra chinensis]|uniref:Secreted protein n=1 Tax=Ranatra chinensis TaxID=642074 RepID=A0ABD0Z7L7_9HEMI
MNACLCRLLLFYHVRVFNQTVMGLGKSLLGCEHFQGKKRLLWLAEKKESVCRQMALRPSDVLGCCNPAGDRHKRERTNRSEPKDRDETAFVTSVYHTTTPVNCSVD